MDQPHGINVNESNRTRSVNTDRSATTLARPAVWSKNNFSSHLRLNYLFSFNYMLSVRGNSRTKRRGAAHQPSTSSFWPWESIVLLLSTHKLKHTLWSVHGSDCNTLIPDLNMSPPAVISGSSAFFHGVYRVSQEEWTKLRESVPYVELYRYNPKHLYPKLYGYEDNVQRSLKLWQLLHTYWLPNTY